MNSLSLTEKHSRSSLVNSIRQNKQPHRSIGLYTYNGRIRSTMIYTPEHNSQQAGSISTLKTSKITVSYSNLVHYSDQNFSSFRGV
ncbi:MAG: hypothetical protein KGH85_08710, partial [Thaumarchaeota archaeon]|nr:hypothetical protein [Nitrososphaerota archaeon]